ncbi:hypothetical protein M662_16690 [Bacillus sp. SB49]|uniref:hypothetical protein n=1 Tax=Bacillus sp. SB49 TaxID=1071080 RepID=UPI0004125F8B|nr:hypothetical protein [Bacillus sp. SB49]QHT48046.1 hypothetical protein M662_16690 [Bacillus sp. SB49]
MKKVRRVGAAIILLFILGACSSGEPLVEKDYRDFMDTMQSEDFTGFAYILTKFKGEDNGYLTTMEEIFDETGASLMYYNAVSDSEDFEVFNKESGTIAIYQPTNTIAFIENGEPKKELDITEEIMSEDNHETLKEFIENNKK